MPDGLTRGREIVAFVLLFLAAIAALVGSSGAGLAATPSAPEASESLQTRLGAVVPVNGTTAGDAGDSDELTYHFALDNALTQLVRADGSHLGIAHVVAAYGSADGMAIHDDGVDVASPSYAGHAGPKTPVGMNLSNAAGWPNIIVPSGQVAIDPVVGRFRFHQGAAPSLVGNWIPVPAGAHDGVAVQGRYAYVTDWTRGLDIIDIDDPANPEWKGNAPAIDPDIGNGMDVVVDGDYAYAAMSVGGVRIYDITDPTDPTRLGTAKAPTNEKALHLQKVGDLLYVADETNGVIIYNVSTPGAPTEVGRIPVGFAESVWVQGDYAYVATGLTGLYVYDISVPSTSVYRGWLAKVGYSYDVVTWGDYAYVAEGSAGLRVVDVSNPTALAHVTTVSTAGEAYDVRVANRSVYVAERGTPGYVEVFGLSDAASPTLLKQYQSPSRVSGLYPVGPLVYAAGLGQGLLVIDANLSETPLGPVTVDYSWDDASAAATPTTALTPTETPDPNSTCTLTVQVALQARGNAPSPEWQVPIYVDLAVAGGGPVQHSYVPTSSTDGQATVLGVPQGAWDLYARTETSLPNVRRSLSLGAGSHVYDMGTLIEGDSIMDGTINILDFSLLASNYGASQGSPGYVPRADFNGDGTINILDFSLLAANYGLTGPREEP